jgi:hypothetical protein
MYYLDVLQLQRVNNRHLFEHLDYHLVGQSSWHIVKENEGGRSRFVLNFFF